jgi:hypothetical protein
MILEPDKNIRGSPADSVKPSEAEPLFLMSGIQDNGYSHMATAYCRYKAGIVLQMFPYIIAFQYHGRYVLASNKKDDFEIIGIA